MVPRDMPRRGGDDGVASTRHIDNEVSGLRLAACHNESGIACTYDTTRFVNRACRPYDTFYDYDTTMLVNHMTTARDRSDHPWSLRMLLLYVTVIWSAVNIVLTKEICRGGSSPKILGGLPPSASSSLPKPKKIRTSYRPTFEIYH